MSTASDYDPAAALRALNQHGVRFVVIGGVAMFVLGTPTTTTDLDVCYARDRANVDALAATLRDLGARLRGVPDDVPFLLDGETIRNGDTFTFTTRVGDLDIHGSPRGTAGYDDLCAHAQSYDLGDGLVVLVSSVDDMIRMKKASGRAKDRAHLDLLRALKEQSTP
jgi:hypothetical protein